MNGDERRASDHESAEDPAGEAARLDGNVAAGILSEVFVPDITTTRAMCANCGAVRPLGTLPVYGQTMGAVMRFPPATRSCCALRARRGNCASIRPEQGSY